MIRGCAIFGFAILGTACADSPEKRLATAAEIAHPSGLALSWIRGGDFTLAAFMRLSNPKGPVTVYIEGDGLAWITRTQVSSNPTPRSPMGLRLAALDPGSNVVYLARPCQYTGVGTNPHCTADLWSGARFSEDVIGSLNLAIDVILPQDHGPLGLVGYSGGGAVALLVAARRHDVGSVRTVAGNLDSGAVTELHAVTPLVASLDPADAAPALAGLPQIHYVGGKDTVVPPAISESYIRKAGDDRCISVRVLPDASHDRGWTEAWPGLVTATPRCESETAR